MKSAAIIFQFAGDERADKDTRLSRIRILRIRMCSTKRTRLSSAYFTLRMSNRILIKSSSVPQFPFAFPISTVGGIT